NFTQDFSFTIWAKAALGDTWPNRTWVIFKYPGANNFSSVELFTKLDYWQNIAVIQKGEQVKVYVDGLLKGQFIRTMDMTGFAIIIDAPHKTGGYCYLDGGKTFDEALTQE